jgi:formate dehydrogenase gamma subunit
MMQSQPDRIMDGRVRRFSAYRITEHWLVILLFCVLVVTGLSQKFYYLEISQWLIFSLGGIDDTRLIHRWSGVGFALLCLEHIAVAAFGLIMLKWQPHMVITKKDFQDARHNVRYYIGLEARPSSCARYNYKEKFVYWLVVTGGLIMVATGFCLWFPTEVVRVLPGQLIPAAKVMHSSEAMLIFLLLAVWHIYDSIFSPDVFPLDTSIFSGYITRERMVREHPLELAELEGVSPDEFDEREGGSPEGGEAGGP